MKCSKCQYENPEGTKFCGECGAKLEKFCPACGYSNPPQFKFCGECGQSLNAPAPSESRDLSFDEKLDKIQRYLPEGLTQKILSQRDRIEGERKQVTVMFCDMEGFTPLAERLGPEGIYSLMDEVYEILIHKVNDFGGTVNELTGDGIMALFGAPVALEDAPQRAIRSAIAVHKEIGRFSERMSREKSISPIRMRIGIHSGPVVVGTVGNDLRVEFKAVGETVNLASRMEGLAEPGATYVTGEMFNLTEGFFRFESLGEKHVKGKKEAVNVYRVIAPSTRRTRFDVSAERGLTAFVGRERELELVLDGFQRAKEGKGQAFSIIGEAGVGKSRFLYEFRKAVANDDITFLEGKCLSYSKGVPYHPIVDILKGNFDIQEQDGDELIREKVKRNTKRLQADEATTLPYLLELLSVKDSGIDKIPMSPEGRKMRIIEALNRIVIKGSEIRPLILGIEDLHWTDKSSEEAFKWLLEAIPGARVMVMFTYRPEYVHTWGSRSYHNQMNLTRLSNRESLLMVSHLLGTGDVDTGIQRLILAKTEGVPFFIEEFVKSLRELELIRIEEGRVCLQGDPKSLAVPTTIQEMIMARVDRLPDPAKAVLQAGSVIEREFPHELIGKVTGLPELELLSHLSALKDAELVYERGIYPQASYIFRHALTREVVYNSILANRCKAFHAEIAGAIEAHHKDDLAEHYEILSEHFCQSEDYAKAAEYSKLAARKAEKSASLPDAITHARKRVLYVEKLPDSGDEARELIDARTVLGLYLNQIAYHVEARDAVEPVARLAREKGYWKRLGQIQTVIGSYYGIVEEDFPNAFEALDEALRIATEEEDTITLLLASFWSGIFQTFNCDFEKARNSIQRAVDINIAAKSLLGTASMKAQLAYFYYYFTGRINSLIELSLEALEDAQESGDPVSMGISHTIYGFACYAKRHLEDAENHALEGRNLCGRIGFYVWAGLASACLAETYFERAEYQKSQDCYDQMSRFEQQARISPSFVRRGKFGMARCGVMLGKRDVELASLRAIAERNRIRLHEGLICRFLGEILLNLGGSHIAEAEQWTRKAIEADARNGKRFDLSKDYAIYSDFYKRKGDRTKAQENLGKAIEIMRKCGADGWVEKYERELATLQ